MTRVWARTPLRVKLVGTLVVLVAGALAAAGAVAATMLRTSLVQRVDTQLAEQLHHAAEYHGDGGGPGPGGDGGPGSVQNVYYVQYVDAAGRVTTPYADAVDSPPRLPALTTAQVAARSAKAFTVGSKDGTQWRVRVSLRDGGAGAVFVARDLDDVDNTVGRLASLELVIGLGVLLILGSLGYVLVRGSLRPLAGVERTAAAIAAGDLSRRVPEGDPRTEVGRLSTALNTMLHQIESAFRTREASEAAARESEARMRRFVTDASHELRTPLTSIRGFAELYRHGAADDVPRLMRRIEDEGARMGLLVDDLLLLARLDQERPLASAPVDLGPLAADAALDARAVDPARPVRLDVRDAPLVVDGDEARLRQVLANLVGNALAHTPAGTPVTVAAYDRGDGHAVLEVADRGPGLPAAEAERVFERFYRTDRSRTRASGGTGLGLSIVAALAAAHGGTVELDTKEGGGATFRVVLPLSSGP